MIATVCIRRATIADAEAVLRGINEVCAEREFFSTAHYVPSPQWEALLYRPHEVPDHLLYVAEQGDEIIGAAQILPGPDPSSLARKGELGIFVRVPFRNRGIGSTLLATILKKAKIYYHKVTLYVLVDNNRAIHLFRKVGFSEVARRQHRYAYLGQQEQVEMSIGLRSR
jgi:ribosomal protein S18 acetylase RimI-like enzyme